MDYYSLSYNGSTYTVFFFFFFFTNVTEGYLFTHSNTLNLASTADKHLSRFVLIRRNGELSLTG